MTDVQAGAILGRDLELAGDNLPGRAIACLISGRRREQNLIRIPVAQCAQLVHTQASSGESHLNLGGICAWGHNEISFEAMGAAIIEHVDAVINTDCPEFRELRNIRAPLPGIGATEIRAVRSKRVSPRMVLFGDAPANSIRMPPGERPANSM